MKLAIISDIHGNFEALTSTLEDIQRRVADEVICLGDIVGYGPDPSRCLATLQERKIPCLMGNHDAATFDMDVRSTFSPLARIAMEWTAGRLSNGEIDQLRDFPYTLQRHGLAFVHASPLAPEEFNYVLDIDDAAGNFDAFHEPLCFIGHSHQPAIYCEDLVGRSVVRGMRAIVNVGSVGQPRDGDKRACFGLFDSEAWTFEHVRVSYPADITAGKIYAAGLPQQLGERLVFGI